MAQCIFNGNIKDVRGALQKKTWYENGVKHSRVTFASVRNGKQRIYTRTYGERRTKPSAAEQQARENFAFVTQRYHQMTPEEKEAYALCWRNDKYMFNGKKYATLRGYCVARFLAALKNEQKD